MRLTEASVRWCCTMNAAAWRVLETGEGGERLRRIAHWYVHRWDGIGYAPTCGPRGWLP